MPSDNQLYSPSDFFECKQCGDCCKGYGGTFVSEKNIIAIAEYLGIDPDRFVDKFCTFSGGKPVLSQDKNGYCIFWDGTCTIHPVKPEMCKRWPFIKGLLADIGNWYIMAESCPGIRINIPEKIIKEGVAKLCLKQS